MKTHMVCIDGTGTEVKLCDFLLTDQELTRNWKEVTCKKCLKKRIKSEILKWSCEDAARRIDDEEIEGPVITKSGVHQNIPVTKYFGDGHEEIKLEGE